MPESGQFGALAGRAPGAFARNRGLLVSATTGPARTYARPTIGHKMAAPLLRGIIRLSLAMPLLGAAIATSALTSCSAIEDAVADQGVSSMDCNTLADDAVRISSEQESLVELLIVRSPTVVTNNVDSYALPGAQERASC